jgi:hypothetical protein
MHDETSELFWLEFPWWLRTLNISLSPSWRFEISLLRILFCSVPFFFNKYWVVSPLSDVWLVKILSESLGCHLALLTVSFAFQKLCSFMRSHLSIVDLKAWIIGVLFRKRSPVLMHSKAFPTFSSRRFSVCLSWLSLLIHHQDDQDLNCIQLINMFISVPIPCSVYHYCSVVQHEVRYSNSSWSSFIVEDCLRYHSFVCLFVFPHEDENLSFKAYKKLCGSFDGYGIESVDCFWLRLSFYYLNSINQRAWQIFLSTNTFFKFFFSGTWSSCHTDLSLAWLDLNRYFILFVGIVTNVVTLISFSLIICK